MGEDGNVQRGSRESSSPSRTPAVFVADASAEAERIAATLRSAGYAVIDVPLSLLAARAQVERPSIVLLDVDAVGALAEVGRLRRLPGAGAIDFLYFGSGGGIVRNADDAIANEGSAFFERPIDIGGLVRKIEALTGGPVARPEIRPSTPPPSIPASRMLKPVSVGPPSSDRPSQPSLPALGVRTPGPPLPMSTPSLADLVDPPRSFAAFGTVSNELQQLLSEAELRAEVLATPEAVLATPEEEIEAVLPADVLASLDEPIDSDEDEETGDTGLRTGPGTQDTGAHAKGTTTGGSKQTTASGRRTPAQTHERPVPRAGETPVLDKSSALRSRPPASLRTPAPEERPRSDPPGGPASLPPEALRGPSVQPGPPVSPGVVLGPGDARRFLGEAIARRSSGALCFEHERVVRRIVVREGDLVTAASGGEYESLVHFLGARGELPRGEIERLAGKIPPYGRHAGAALVAHGWLRQDQLWAVLRSHSEWIASAVLRMPSGTAQLEPDPPGRLRAEPSVFGAATGAEIFVDLVRRAVTPDEAIADLGGEGSRIGDGPNPSLLAECALPPHDLELVSRSRGGTVGDLLARAPDAEIAAVVLALALLGVADIAPAPSPPRAPDRSSENLEVVALDEEAIRARVRARLELVDEGDYFSLLGVARDATSYEVRRAFIELRRAFEPSRILTPRLFDLAEDVRKIVVVLEEAYEILRDGARRERYRKAIEAHPE